MPIAALFTIYLNVTLQVYAQASEVILIFFNSYIGGWSPSWDHSARRQLNGLLYLPRVIMMMENLVEWRLAWETEALGENLPSATLSTTNPTWPDPGLNPGRRCGKPAINRLSYGAAPEVILSVGVILPGFHIKP
jgi:hypothetical protein